MESNNELLNKVKVLDDEGLRSGIENVAKAMGADTNALGAYLSDIKKIRRTVDSLTERDIEKIFAAIGEKRAEELKKNIAAELGRGM